MISMKARITSPIEGVTTAPRTDTAWTTAGDRLSRHPMVSALGNGNAEIFMAPDFITMRGREALAALINAKRRPSDIADSNGDAMFRTSQTCDMDDHEPVVAATRAAIASLLGIDIAYAEPLQGQRYGPGGEFKAHTDYFEPLAADYAKYCTVAGQRTWTAMAYVTEPQSGGNTTFPNLGVDMAPTAGTLLVWSNLKRDGTPNPATLHHATPVGAGIKDVITLWFRQRPWG